MKKIIRIRTVKHTYNDTNLLKKQNLYSALMEYHNACQFYLDYYWKIYAEDPNSNYYLSDYLDYKVLDDKTKEIIAPNLTCRALNSACDEVTGKLKSALATKAKLQYALKKNIEKNEELKQQGFLEKDLSKLKEKYDGLKLYKPTLKPEKVSADISSKCVTILYPKLDNLQSELSIAASQSNDKIQSLLAKIKVKPTKTDISKFVIEKNKLKKENEGKFKHFNLFLEIRLTNTPIFIPVKFNKQDIKFLNKGGRLLNGIEFRKNSFDLRYELKDIKKKTIGRIVGADTGVNSIVTLSDGQVTPYKNKHNKTFPGILEELSTCKKGTKKFLRLQRQRENFINEAINTLDFSEIKQINLEHISNLFYGKNTSPYMKRWTNTIIEEKIQSKAEDEGVLIVLQNSAYYSQRCHCCGMVKKTQRKGKIFSCENIDCKMHEVHFDADLNSAINHEQELFELPKWIFKSGINKSGFFWKEDNLYLINSGKFVILEYNDTIKQAKL